MAMSTVTAKSEITPEQLLARPDAVRFELVDGELVERKVGVLSAAVEMLVASALLAYCQSTRSGRVWGGTLGYQCFKDMPGKIRKPDASFVRATRFSPAFWKEGYLTIAPDLAVEVVSPNDTAHEITEKVEEYLAAGVPLVWVVYPESQIVAIHRKDGTVSKLHADAELSGEDVLPGFHCRVDALFPQARD